MKETKTHMVRLTNEHLFIRAKAKAAHELISLGELVEKALKQYLSKKPIDR